jgi:VCBS repeat-containing protein
MKTYTINETQLRVMQLRIGKAITELEAIAVNQTFTQVIAAEIKPKEETPCAENTTKQSTPQTKESDPKNKPS